MDDYEEPMSPEMQRKKWSPGYLYILDYGDGEQFKIGITGNNPELRANQITRNVGLLVPNPVSAQLVVALDMDTNPYYLEQLIHMQYRSYHVGGEWFELGNVDTLANLLITIEPFGAITYYDRWYSYFGDDFVPYVISGMYPEGLDYHRTVRLSNLRSHHLLSMRDSDTESLKKVVAAWEVDAKKYPDSFKGNLVKVDYRTRDERSEQAKGFFLSEDIEERENNVSN